MTDVSPLNSRMNEVIILQTGYCSVRAIAHSAANIFIPSQRSLLNNTSGGYRGDGSAVGGEHSNMYLLHGPYTH
jgi:hypothetical protein